MGECMVLRLHWISYWLTSLCLALVAAFVWDVVLAWIISIGLLVWCVLRTGHGFSSSGYSVTLLMSIG